jgi:hypothetical protein
MLGLGLSGRTGGSFVGPVLANPVDTANGPTGAIATVDTDTSPGILYWTVLLTADSNPTDPSYVRDGLKADGITPAEKFGSQAVASSGTQTLSPAPTLLTPGVGYKIAYVHYTGGPSNIVVGDGFTTAAVLVGQMALGQSSITNPIPVTGSIAVAINDVITVMTCEQTATGTVTAVTDNLGNSYTAINAGLFNSTAYGRGFYSVATVAGTLTTVNVAATASTNDSAVDVCVFNGPFSTVDATPAAKTDNASTMTGTATGTLAQASELVVGMMASTSTGATIGAFTNWTLCGTPAATGLRRASTIYQNVSATTSVTPAFTTSNTSDTTVVQTVSFKRSA